MQASRPYRLTKTLCILIAGYGQPATLSAQDAGLRADHFEKSHALVARLEDELRTMEGLLARQASSEAEVDLVKARLAMARHDLALFEDRRDDVVKQRRQLVEIRGRQLQRFLRAAGLGFGSKLKMSTAQRRLACSRYLLDSIEGKPDAAIAQLELVVELCKREVAELTKLNDRGAVSLVELNRARHRATIAQYRLAREQDAGQSLIPEIRAAVELCQREWEQIKKLEALDYAELIHVYAARCHLLNAKLLLANLEQDRDSAIALFDQLIGTHQQTIPKLGRRPPEGEYRMWIEQDLTRDLQRKKQFHRDGYLADDLSAAELDP